MKKLFEENNKKKKGASSTLKGVLTAVVAIFFAGIAVVSVVLGVSYINNKSFEERFVQVKSNKIYDRMRILQISDLHGTEYGEGNRDLVDRAINLKPDMIVMTGDMLDSENDLDGLLDVCRQLVEVAPTYYVYGNNEVDIAKQMSVIEEPKETEAEDEDEEVSEIEAYKEKFKAKKEAEEKAEQEDPVEPAPITGQTATAGEQPTAGQAPAEQTAQTAAQAAVQTETQPAAETAVQQPAEQAVPTAEQSVTEQPVQQETQPVEEAKKEEEPEPEAKDNDGVDLRSKHGMLEKKLEAAGVKVLLNEKDTIEIGKDEIEVFGLLSTNPKVFWPYAGEVYYDYYYNQNPNNFKLFLAHEPNIFNEWHDEEPWGDLVLCGHTHGGVIRLPRYGAVYAQEQGLFPERKGAYVKGKYMLGDTTLILSSGLTNKGMIRINNKPELVVIDIKRF